MKKLTLTIIGLTCFFCSFSIKGFSQKLPSLQKQSLFAPKNFDINGVTGDWGDKFQAYNKSTNIFYTIANDFKNLYVIIQATDSQIIEKIMGGGITFTIEDPFKSENSVPFSITFPLLETKDRAHFVHQIKDTSLVFAQILPDLNYELNTKSNNIQIKGFAPVSDSLVSVHNEYGIKAKNLLNDKRAYFYALSVPLTALPQTKNKEKGVNYKIILNGIKASSYVIKIRGKQIDSSSPQAQALLNQIYGFGPSAFLELTTPTDLTGKYVLAIK